MQFRQYFTQKKKAIVREILKVIPKDILEETDDKSELIKRIFEDHLDFEDLDRDIGEPNVQEFTYKFLTNGQVGTPLRKEKVTQAPMLSTTGRARWFEIPMQQVLIGWAHENDKLVVYLQFPDEDEAEKIIEYPFK